ncbi:helix-turn-helix domain-containing protein [Bosea sp. TWI1241]|uniref:helix-turn-helix domain-containing protein n=1 Tax=Bosea sp. TWI1241 TaxID=3148904 RepID=UPI0032086F0F
MSANALRSLREERGWTLEQVAEATGLSVSYVQRLERGERNLSVKNIDKFAAAFGVPRERVISRDRVDVPIVGLAGAGPNASVIFGMGQGSAETAPAPPLWTPQTVALEVRGNSMRGIAFDGWYVYYDDVRGEITEDMIGQPCVIGLEGDEVVVKLPYYGREPGTFDLESSNQAVDTMRGRRVEWACIVTAIVPRNPARRLLDRSANEASV